MIEAIFHFIFFFSVTYRVFDGYARTGFRNGSTNITAADATTVHHGSQFARDPYGRLRHQNVIIFFHFRPSPLSPYQIINISYRHDFNIHTNVVSHIFYDHFYRFKRIFTRLMYSIAEYR